MNSVVNSLEDIEKNQIKISETLSGLRDEERAAQEIAERFDSELLISSHITFFISRKDISLSHMINSNVMLKNVICQDFLKIILIYSL